jgi:hypothetical protein
MSGPLKPLFMREAAMHFLRDTVVHSMEGVLFVLLSALFTLAGAAAFVEGPALGGSTSTMTASAAPLPDSSTRVKLPPQQFAAAPNPYAVSSR